MSIRNTVPRQRATNSECDDLVSAMDAVGLHKTYNVPGLLSRPDMSG